MLNKQNSLMCNKVQYFHFFGYNLLLTNTTCTICYIIPQHLVILQLLWNVLVVPMFYLLYHLSCRILSIVLLRLHAVWKIWQTWIINIWYEFVIIELRTTTYTSIKLSYTLSGIMIGINILGHERRVDSFSVKFCCHFCSLFYVSTIHKPEPCGYCSRKVDAVVDKRKWCRSSNIFPLSSCCTSCKHETDISGEIIVYMKCIWGKCNNPCW